MLRTCIALAAIVVLAAVAPCAALAQAPCCPGVQAAKAAEPPSPATGTARRVYSLADPAHPRLMGYSRLVDTLVQADVAFLGEYHEDPATHLFELDLLTQFYRAKQGAVVLSLEMFERDVQGVLDDYLAGRITEEEFLKQSRPWDNYDKDYRPLIEFAKEHHVPVIGANIPRPLASRVAKEGLDAALASFTPEERSWAAQSATAPRDAYFESFREVMSGAEGGGAHGGGMPMTDEMIYQIYQAQCIKDDTMAESIAHAHTAHPGALVVHFTGSFHVDHRLGTAMRVASREGTARLFTVALRPADSMAALDPLAESLPDGTPLADYVLFVPAPPAPAEESQPDPAPGKEAAPEKPAAPAMPAASS
jgi:uncharacterized iron-regulated protein